MARSETTNNTTDKKRSLKGKSKGPEPMLEAAESRVATNDFKTNKLSVQNPLENIETLQAHLWDAADNLRANSKLTANEYCMPVLGIIFLRHATNRYNEAQKDIEAEQASGRMPKRSLTAADFKKRRALMLPKEARYEELIQLPKGANLGKALVDAMEAVERDFQPLAEVLPKDYARFDNTLLEEMLRVFDSEALRTASGDVFGRINEYFLMKFAMQGAQDNGEFFTPPSLVQTIVNVIEPDHGIVFDPAAGSGGMFVQTSHFIEEHGENPAHKVTFYGHEYKTSNLRLAKMNLAVHALEGDIKEANTFYEDPHELFNRCDFVMANPPFNVDKVDAVKASIDRRLPFGLPGVNKNKKVSNGNYLWISYFWSYLNNSGRAGFVMSSQASSAGNKEAEVRRKIVETGDVDVIISIRSNFFYTRTVPCELWHFDRGKPDYRRETVLMIDARNIYRKVTRKIYDFLPEQLQNLTAIVWLYRGQQDRFLNLVGEHMDKSLLAANRCLMSTAEDGEALNPLGDYLESTKKLKEQVMPFVSSIREQSPHDEIIGNYVDGDKHSNAPIEEFRFLINDTWNRWKQRGEGMHGLCDFHDNMLITLSNRSHELISVIDEHLKATDRLIALCENDLSATESELWNTREVSRARKAIDEARQNAIKHLKQVRYFQRHAAWLIERFPNAEFVAVPGLCRSVDRQGIELAQWSLTPGRYVGAAPSESDGDFDFERTMTEIHLELAELDHEAALLARHIQKNFEDLKI